MNKNKKRFFSLIEIIIVVTIMALIAAIAAKQIFGQDDEARVQLTKTSLNTLAMTITQFKVKHGKLPESLEELVQNTHNREGWTQLADELPVDAWGTAINYSLDQNNRQGFSLTSLGADGIPGGQGVHSDISFPAKKN